jgi:putative ABC transport system ATP-binding protein
MSRERRRRTTLALRAVSKSYGTGDVAVAALSDVDLAVERGDFVAVMGSSGSGKSTLMNLIGCLDVPTSGRYLLEGIDVAELDDFELAYIRNRKIGFVFQSFNLIPRTSALRNVELPLIYARVARAERRGRAVEALREVGLAHRMEHDPSELSGGQQQRVAIARALLRDAPILLLDEATSSLDAQSEHYVQQALERLMRGRTTLVIAHRLATVQRADRIVVLDAGRIVAQGTHAELVRQDGLYAELARLQFAA